MILLIIRNITLMPPPQTPPLGPSILTTPSPPTGHEGTHTPLGKGRARSPRPPMKEEGRHPKKRRISPPKAPSEKAPSKPTQAQIAQQWKRDLDMPLSALPFVQDERRASLGFSVRIGGGVGSSGSQKQDVCKHDFRSRRRYLRRLARLRREPAEEEEQQQGAGMRAQRATAAARRTRATAAAATTADASAGATTP